MTPPYSLMVILDYGFLGDEVAWLEVIDQLNGINCEPGQIAIQVRIKDLETMRSERLGKQARDLLSNTNILVLWNGSFEFAIANGFDGHHLPEADLSSIEKPDDWIYSTSAHSIEAVLHAQTNQVDSVLFGPIWPPNWKESSSIGLDQLKQASSITDLKLLALGGITLSRIEEVKSCKADGLAVLSGILGEKNVADVAEAYLNRWLS